jgi:hypothetical protein
MVSKLSKVVALKGLFGNNSTVFYNHLDSESFTIPRVDGPDFTSEHNSVDFWMDFIGFEGSPELVSLSAFAVSTIVRMALACLSSS